MNRSRFCIPGQVGTANLAPQFNTLEQFPGLLNWEEFFGNSNPVELEVGSGRGLFLVRAAQEQPGTNFLGLELDYKEARYAARRIIKRGLENVRVLGGDARVALARCIPAQSLAAAHVYFPDPWWKRRHWPRRIFNREFIGEMTRVIQPGGLLHSWTDVEEYFKVISKLLAGDPGFRQLPTPPEREALDDMDYHTNFERKKRKLGLPIYRGCWERFGGMPQ